MSYFIVSRTLGALLTPSAAAAALLLLAVLVKRWRALAFTLAVTAMASYLALASPRVASALERTLDGSGRTTARLQEAPYDAAIVLGGEPERVDRGAELIRAGRARQLLYSGWMRRDDVPAFRAALRSKGVPEGKLVLELHSRNTRENAVESARVVAAHGWRSLLLVTSAPHVARAEGCFRGVGLRPDVEPVDDGAARLDTSWAPSQAGLTRSAAALHELAARAVYRALGYST